MAGKRNEVRHEIIDRLCRDFPKAGSRTIARRIHAEHPAQFPTFDIACQAVRLHRGNKGAKNRKWATRPRPNGGELPPLPEAIEEAWTPFEIDCRRCLVLGDIHLPFHVPRAIEAALKFGDTFKPDAVFFNGDVFDFYSLSRFDKNPTLSKVEDELLAGGELFDHVRARFPKAQIVFKLGNHDERWEKYIFNAAPLLADVKGIKDGWEIPAGIERNKVAVVRNKRPVMLGKLPLLHGHEIDSTSSVHPARTAWLKAQHTVAVNHFHQSSGFAPTNMFHDEMYSWSIACLCGLTPPYRPINSWNHGFAAVEVHRDKSFDVHNMRIERSGKVRAS